MSSRRNFLQRAFGLTAGLLGAAGMAEATAADTRRPASEHQRSSATGPPVPVITPDVADLPFTLDNGAKVFHLIAEPVKQELIPGKTLNLWGFNGSAPGPTIQVNRGDHVRVIVDNHLPEPTAMHWHGFEISNAMDGGPGISQTPIRPGGRFVYEFTLHQEGTFFYHSHMAMQEMMGMLGAFIMHPRNSYRPHVDKDFVILLQEYALLPNNSTPNSMNMEFNWLTFNGKSGPATTPLIIRLGDRVRIRLINLGMDHHPIHLHGHTFYVTGTEGGRQPETLWGPGNTVLVGVAQARDIEFNATNPGDWMLHCHLPHHMMNAMSSTVGKMGASADQRTTNGPLSLPTANGPAPLAHGDMQEMHMPGLADADIAPNANSVPGFPQDAFMEGPMMAMDQMVASPGNYGLPPGWSGFMQGMMSLVRVLPPDMYDKVMAQIQQAPKRQEHSMPEMEHHPHGK